MNVKKSLKNYMSSEIILTGVFHHFNRDLNGRIYPKSVMEKELKRLERQIIIKQRKEKLEKIKKDI
jgi:hypothetical protein